MFGACRLDEQFYAELATILNERRDKWTTIRTVGTHDRHGSPTGDLEGCHSIVDVAVIVTGKHHDHCFGLIHTCCVTKYKDVTHFVFEGPGEHFTPVAKMKTIAIIIMSLSDRLTVQPLQPLFSLHTTVTALQTQVSYLQGIHSRRSGDASVQSDVFEAVD
jgi:hypothetical protein